MSPQFSAPVVRVEGCCTGICVSVCVVVVVRGGGREKPFVEMFWLCERECMLLFLFSVRSLQVLYGVRRAAVDTLHSDLPCAFRRCTLSSIQHHGDPSVVRATNAILSHVLMHLVEM
jgi:hypothetical protein